MIEKKHLVFILLFLSIAVLLSLFIKYFGQSINENLITAVSGSIPAIPGPALLREKNNDELLNIYLKNNLICLNQDNGFYDYIKKNNPEQKDLFPATQLNTEPMEKQNGTSVLLVNVNTADLEELTKLPGIGKVIAGNIIQYREEYGPFKKLEDLLNVKGIGEKTLEKIKPYITIINSTDEEE